jgi:hypothetical protein
MQHKVLIAIVGSLLVVLGGALGGFCGEADDGRLQQLYGTFVDDYIQKCEAKAEMLDSSSLNIREDAMRATVKGAFAQSNRLGMIRHLVEKKVPLNAERIKYHLNRIFAESVQPQEVYAMLKNDQVDR